MMKIMLIYVFKYLLINHNCFQNNNESWVIYQRNKHGFMYPLENFPCLPNIVGKQHNVSVWRMLIKKGSPYSCMKLP